MGGVCSALTAPPLSPFEAKCLKAIQNQAAANLDKLKNASLGSVLRKFGHWRFFFEQCKKVFEEYDGNKSNTLDLKELQACATQLKVVPTGMSIEESFREVDVDNTNDLNFGEFLLYLVTVNMVNSETQNVAASINWEEPVSDESPESMEGISRALTVVVMAWTLLDGNSNGYISKRETLAVATQGHQNRQVDIDLAEKLFKGLDADGNGNVSFKEFTLGFQCLQDYNMAHLDTL
ncbi:hypothetical protein CYMTET_43795 [Cymbomonas tetramitiformis]|uniref:EF-hand domain-containing protein n=1 Tax=Cymbomonas tetramitiformis TaxID=36881 RepID=A0AAE0C1F1_9CHLO|nr:hypothetical protein CYMTET_43795 [Cymbomonas tetramitiformis]|eukprot:gene11928-14087_t